MQNTERLKTSFLKWIGRKCRLLYTRIEQNNDYTQIMHEIQFRSSFNVEKISKEEYWVWNLNQLIAIKGTKTSAELGKSFYNPDSKFLGDLFWPPITLELRKIILPTSLSILSIVLLFNIAKVFFESCRNQKGFWELFRVDLCNYWNDWNDLLF